MEEPQARQGGKGGPLDGKRVVLTGELESLTRGRAQELVKERGGIPIDSVSRKTDYVVVGENPGSKAQKARDLGVKTLDEEAFLVLLQIRGDRHEEEAR